MGQLIVIEGTDCSGKETQTNLLMERLKNDGFNVKKFGFPIYDSPTGKIVGGPYLGKKYICDGWFPEGAPNVNYKVASLYYAADRLYNIEIINKALEENDYVILDRYVYSNMAHQGGKIDNQNRRFNMYNWLSELEFSLLNLPIPDIKIFLHMPTECAKILKKYREEEPDQHEADENHLINAEKAYLEIADIYEFNKIECSYGNEIRAIEDINNELYLIVKNKIKKY